MSSSENKQDKIEVFENISDKVKTFNNKEEFMSYYENHKSEIDSMKTRGLNMKYTIPGFKIGKRKNIITLYPIKDDNKDKKDNNELNTEIKQKLDHIEQSLIHLINLIDLSQQMTVPNNTPNVDLRQSLNKNKNPTANPWK